MGQMMCVTRLALTLLLLLLQCIGHIGSEYISACYYTSWSSASSKNIQLPVDKIDPGLCTHLVYAFAKFDVLGLKLVPNEAHIELLMSGKPSLFTQFNNLKKKNSNLHTILSVGGQGEHLSADFTAVARTPESVRKLARNSVQFLRKLGFDGLDIDWEYPTNHTKAVYVDLLQGFHEIFEEEARTSGRRRLLLTVAVAAGKHYVVPGYNVPAISKYVDYIFLMAYDFFGTWSDVTGFNAPLNRRSDAKFAPENSVEFAVDLWLGLGAPRRKLVLGMTGAGAVFTLNNSKEHGVGAHVQKGNAKTGSLFLQRGRLIYPEICLALNAGWTRVWDAEQQVPYAYQRDQWVGYDDKDSIKEKVEYIKDQRLAGSMFWELSFDDPLGKYCSQGNFPLLNVIKKGLGLESENPLTKNVDKNVVLMTKDESTGSVLCSSSFLISAVLCLIFTKVIDIL